MTYNHPDFLNNNPYNDDFEDTKRFLRILFKPGYSVQARELTQLQTLLQNQISKFGDHIFRDGSLVFGGLTSLNRTSYVRVNDNYILGNLNNVVGQTIINLNSSVRAKCLYVLPSESTDNNAILFLQYLTGQEFTPGEKLFVGDNATSLTSVWGGLTTEPVTVQALNAFETENGRTATMAAVDEGIFYVDGFFVRNERQTIPLYAFANGVRNFISPSNRVGFNVNRVVVNSSQDPTLKDPANGSYNFNAPGADRYKIDLILKSETFVGDLSAFSAQDLSNKDFIELARVVGGKLSFVKKIPTYSDILEVFARRTYDESGNYTVKPFTINIKENLRKDRLRFIVQLTPGSIAGASDNTLSFLLPSNPTGTSVSYEIGNSESNRLPPNIGDTLIADDLVGTEYTIVSVKTIDLTNGTVDLEVVPEDQYVTATNNPYSNNKPVINSRFNLKRAGNTTIVTENHYKNTSNTVTTITDITGSFSLLSGGDSNKFSVDVSNGKAYIFGYEFETTNPITVSIEKPRETLTAANEIIDTSLGNYLKVTSESNKFDPVGLKYDTNFDLNNFPDVLLKKKFITLLLPNQSVKYSVFNVKYYTPSTRKSVNQYQPTSGYYNWETGASNTLSEADKLNLGYYYPDVVFLQSTSPGTTNGKVLKKELDTNDSADGFIERREIGNNQEYTTLLPNDNTKNIPIKFDKSGLRPEILDSSYETETNISRLVFNEAWHGDFKTAYDSSFEGYNPVTDKLTRVYNDDTSNYVYQLDYISLGNVPVDGAGNVSISNLQNHIRVKRAYTRAWVPGATREIGYITPGTLYINIPTANVVFGPDIGVSRGFCLPDTNPTIQESGVIFNPSEGKELSYGSSIVASSQEFNVVELTLLTPPDAANCAQTLGSITTRGFGNYTEGSIVTQTYIRYDGSQTEGGTSVTVQGTILKVIVQGSSHKVFVKLSGSTGDFIPQNFESIKNDSGDFKYAGVSALLMSDNILTAPICACHTIKGVDLLDDKTGTCGIFTTITFSEPGTYGNYQAGEIVYQYDIDYVPIDNLGTPTNFDGTKILAQGTVVTWDSTTSTLTLIVTKNEFKSKSGWIFGKTTKTKYGGRGWSTNYHKTQTVPYTGFSAVNEIEKVTGIIVHIRPNTATVTSHGFIDEFNTSNPNIRKIAYQTKSYTEENILPSGWTETNILGKEIIQDYVGIDETTGLSKVINAKGIVSYYKEGSPISGPSILSIEANPLDRSAFAFKIKSANIANIIGKPTLVSSAPNLSFNFLNAEKIKPQASIYDTIQTEPTVGGEIVDSTVVAKAKVKQIKYVAKTGTAGKEQYHVYLTDVIPYSIEGTLFRVDNIYSIARDIGGGKEVTMFIVGDNLVTTGITQFDLQEPKNNSLLYNYPVGSRIKEVTDLTYELQIDLLTTLNTTTNKLTFVTDVPGSTEFKGSYDSGSFKRIDQSILSEYILVGNDSRIIDLTDTTIVEYVRVTEVTNKTIEIKIKDDAMDSIVTGSYRLICPIVIKGSLGSNIRKKIKKRNIEVAKFDPVTGTMTLKKSDVISIDSCINLGTNLELPKQAYKLNNNQTLNLYKLSTVTGNEKWRDLSIRNASNQVTSQPNGIYCLVAYTYYDHGTEFGPIIPSSYEDGYDTIPTFTDPLTNQKIILDSVIDFRPFERISDAGQVVTSGIYGVPISGSRMNVSYTYYLAKNYKLILSRDKKFYLLSGESSTVPQYPSDLSNAMTLFKIQMPAYLTNATDSKIVALNHQRYTMSDIRSLEERIDNIEYVTRLSYLEQNAKNISIFDEDNNERPKTSILVDSFINHEIGDTLNPDYNACVDATNNCLRPPFNINQLDLTLNTKVSSGDYLVVKNAQPPINIGQSLPPNILTLSHTTTPLIKQLLATGTTEINPFSNTVWFGTLTASVYRDPTFDLDFKPYILSNYNGENDTFENMTFSPNNDNNGAFGTKWNFWQTNWQGYIENQTNIRTYLGRVEDQVKALTPKTPKKRIGEKVINVDVVPFMPSKTISIYARGMKPSTRLYPYFDGVRVDAYVTQTGSIIKTDNLGNVNIIFTIPQGTFQSGEKNFILMDNENNDRTLCTTYAEFKYSNTASDLTDDYFGAVGNRLNSSETNDFNDYQTLIAQTFFVDPVQYPKGVYVKKVDIYFQSIDSTLPITLELRPVANGVPMIGPGTSAYQHSTLTLRPNSLRTVRNGAITAQNGSPFEFNAPVHLLPGEHAIVLKTNSSNYSVYSGEVGELVLNTENRASPQPFVGKLMKTNNSQSFTIFENRDIVFNIYRCVFSNTGTIVFTDPVDTRPEVQFSSINLNLVYTDLNSNSVSTTVKTINRSSVNDIVFDTEEMMIVPNTNVDFDKVKYFKYNGTSFTLTINLTSDGVIAPMVDLDSLKLVTINNVIRAMNGARFDKGNTTVSKEENETYPFSVVHEDFINARYITKIVTLDSDMETKDCYVYFKLNKPRGTDVKVYIKRQFADNDINMNDIEYEELDAKVSMGFSSDPNRYNEVYYKLPDERAVNPFIRYSIKIIMFSDTIDGAVVPRVKDLRIITVT